MSRGEDKVNVVVQGELCVCACVRACVCVLSCRHDDRISTGLRL